MTDDQFYEIYNRACARNGGHKPLEGDTALTNMLLGHGYIMNGGLEHFRDLSGEEQRKSIAGYCFFGFSEIAEILVKAPKLSNEELLASEELIVKFDSDALDRIRRYIESNLHQFRS